jgi:hypothetical protein
VRNGSSLWISTLDACSKLGFGLLVCDWVRSPIVYSAGMISQLLHGRWLDSTFNAV